MLFLLSSSSSSLLLLLSSSSSSFCYYYYYYHYYYYHYHHYYYYYYYYYYYHYYSKNNIPYQCDITCAGHFTLDALASRTVACFNMLWTGRNGWCFMPILGIILWAFWLKFYCVIFLFFFYSQTQHICTIKGTRILEWHKSSCYIKRSCYTLKHSVPVTLVPTHLDVGISATLW